MTRTLQLRCSISKWHNKTGFIRRTWQLFICKGICTLFHFCLGFCAIERVVDMSWMMTEKEFEAQKSHQISWNMEMQRAMRLIMNIVSRDQQSIYTAIHVYSHLCGQEKSSFCANVSSRIVERLSVCKNCLCTKVKCMKPYHRTRSIESEWWHQNTFLDRKVAQGTAGYTSLTNRACERRMKSTAIWMKGQSELILFSIHY